MKGGGGEEGRLKKRRRDSHLYFLFMVERLKVRTENEGGAVRRTEAAVNVDDTSDFKK